MKKIGIYGGSFDPIHIGHLITANNVVDELGLDELIFVPSNKTPLKETTLSASNKDRYNMIRESISLNSKLSVSDYEINRDGLSYTYNTIKYFKEEYEASDLYFIVGTDRVQDLHLWYKIKELSELVTFIFVARDKEKLEDIVKKSEFYNSIKYVILDLPVIEISSSLIKQRIKDKKSVTYMLERKCLEYIKEVGLYGFSTNTR